MDSEIDAAFYRLVHELSLTSRSGGPSKRQGKPRKPFAARQRIAPWEGHAFPAESEFTDVQCHDLTQGGFSFFLPQRPQFSEVVVELTTAQEPIYLAAEVCHFTRVLIAGSGPIGPPRRDTDAPGDDRAGQYCLEPGYLVGCRFTRRLYNPAGREVARQAP